MEASLQQRTLLLQQQLQDALWKVAELQVRSFQDRLEQDMKDGIPTDAATLTAITSALKLHGVHLGASKEENDPVADLKGQLAGLKDRLTAKRQSLSAEAVSRVLQ